MRLTMPMNVRAHPARPDGEFVLLATRSEPEVADAEYEAFVRFMGIDRERLRRVRLEAGPMRPWTWTRSPAS